MPVRIGQKESGVECCRKFLALDRGRVEMQIVQTIYATLIRWFHFGDELLRHVRRLDCRVECQSGVQYCQTWFERLILVLLA